MRIHRLSVLFFLGALLFFCFGNHLLVVTDPVESNYALTAKEMVLSGNWISPQIYHHFWYDKPIMVYWLLALSYKFLGITDFAARLPSAVFGALAVALFYQGVRTISGRRLLGIWSALILGTSLEFWIIAHGIVTDMVLLFATVGTALYAYRGLEEKSKLCMTVAYAFAGLAVLTKGPVGLVLPGLLLLIYVLLRRAWTSLPYLFAWQGILAFLLVAGPWYGMIYHVHGEDFVKGFLGLNNVVRATISEHPQDNVWWYYLAMLPLASLPWTGPIVYEMWQGRGKRPFYLYSMVWTWGTVLFYSLMATKYPTYTFITLIPLSFLGALGINRILHPESPRQRWWILLGPALFLWLLLTAASFWVKWGFWYLLYVTVGVGILLALNFYWTRKRHALPFLVAVVTMLVSCVVIHEGLTPLVYKRSGLDLAPIVGTTEGDVFYWNRYSTSLVYYTGKDIAMVLENPAAMEESAWAGKWTMPKISEAEVLTKIADKQKVVVIVSKDEREKDFLRKVAQTEGQVEKLGETKEEAVYVSLPEEP